MDCILFVAIFLPSNLIKPLTPDFRKTRFSLSFTFGINRLIRWQKVNHGVCRAIVIPLNITWKTRKHSSRMRTVRCSGRRGGGGLLQPLEGGCLPQYMLGYTLPPVDRILDTHSWKHHLPATTLRTVIRSVILSSSLDRYSGKVGSCSESTWSCTDRSAERIIHNTTSSLHRSLLYTQIFHVRESVHATFTQAWNYLHACTNVLSNP